MKLLDANVLLYAVNESAPRHREARDRFDAPAATVVGPGPRHLDLLAELLAESGTGGNLTTDAHLAALPLEHRCFVVTYDRDFSRFAGVRSTAPADDAT